jgi:hypothetical protein
VLALPSLRHVKREYVYQEGGVCIKGRAYVSKTGMCVKGRYYISHLPPILQIGEGTPLVCKTKRLSAYAMQIKTAAKAKGRRKQLITIKTTRNENNNNAKL